MANLLLYRSDGASFIEHRIASDWTIISNKPTNFPPTAHNHDASNINAGTLSADRIPNLAISKVTNLQSSLDNIIYRSGDWHHFTDPNPFEIGFIDNSWVNRFNFFPRENILVETSSDGVNFNSTTEYSDTSLKQLFGGDSAPSINIPNLGTIGAGYKRFTFTPYTYVSLSCLYIWSTKVTGTLQVKVEKYNKDTSTWIVIKDYSNIDGWPQHHTLRHETIWWSSTQTYNQVRLTFYGETTNSTYPNHAIRIIQWWGGYPSGNRKPFSFDENKIASFPADVKSNGQVLVKTNDSRLSDSRPASDVYSWAKAATKPSYNQDEVGDGTTYKRVTQSEKDSWNAKSTLVLGETSVTAYRGDRGKTAYDHSQVAHAPSNAITGITKAMVEAVLTDNITTHYHSAYLSFVPEHTDDVGSYGKATTVLYGHVVIKNDLNTSEYLPGEALSAHQGYQLGLNKVEKNQSIIAGTKCKITYDAKGLVTGGADLADTDIPDISAAKITSGTLPIARGGTGVTSLDALKAALALTTNSVTSSRTLALADAQDMIIANHATNEILLTVPLNSSVAFPIGTEITIIRYGAGEVKISATTGVTINSVVNNNNKFINAQYQAATLKKMDTDTWLLFGAIR